MPTTAIAFTCWAGDYWKVYIYTEEHVRCAVRYVENNPLKEGRSMQRWDFVQPLVLETSPRKRGG